MQQLELLHLVVNRSPVFDVVFHAAFLDQALQRGDFVRRTITANEQFRGRETLHHQFPNERQIEAAFGLGHALDVDGRKILGRSGPMPRQPHFHTTLHTGNFPGREKWEFQRFASGRLRHAQNVIGASRQEHAGSVGKIEQERIQKTRLASEQRSYPMANHRPFRASEEPHQETREHIVEDGRN